MAGDAEATAPACSLAHGFLLGRDDARAAAYAARWQARLDLEQQRAAQAHSLDVRHALADPVLDEAQRRWILEQLAAHGQGVRKAWFARRVLPADPTHPSYVLALEFTAWARFRKRQPAVLQRLMQQDWPWPVHACALEDSFKPLRKRLLALPGAQLI
ncbi:MAG: hypothetical protein U1E77_05000 [Inhella sp.]